MRLEHVNLVVKSLDATKQFLLTAFPEWKVRGDGETSWYGRKRNWCHVGDDDYYITLNDGAEGENRDLAGFSPGLAHIGFSVKDVDSIRKRLVEAGYPIEVIGADHPFRKTIYFVDPEGFEFEFMEYQSDEPSERNLYGGETGAVKRFSDKGENNGSKN